MLQPQKNNTCVTKTRNSHQYEANLKTDHIKGNNPKKKNSVPSFASHFVHLMDLRTDHTQVCASTSCAKAAKQTNTIPPRCVYLCRWTSKDHQHRANPLSYITFHRSHVGESTNMTANGCSFFLCAPTTQHPGHFHSKTFCEF